MNPVNYLGCRVRAHQLRTSHPHLLGPLFDVELSFGTQAAPVRVHGVHLSAEAQRLIESGDVTGVSVEDVRANSLSARLLKNAHVLLTGVQMGDHRTICVIPGRIQRLRRWGLVASVIACGAGLASLVTGSPVSAAALLVLSTHAARSFAEMPYRAFPDLHVLQ